MALEAIIYQQNPSIYGCNLYDYNTGFIGDEGSRVIQEEKRNAHQNLNVKGELHSLGFWDSPPFPPAHNTTFSSPSGGVVEPSRRKRRRMKSLKNKEEMENQRMTHIAVERNRRRRMNDYLAVLRSLMPPSYAQRGDQASIVAGAINFVKELEQLVQFMEAQLFNGTDQRPREEDDAHIFSTFFTFPQYSTNEIAAGDSAGGERRRSCIADIEVSMMDSHANIRILIKRRPKQLLKLVAGFHAVCLTVLHINVTSADQSVLYSFSVKVEDACHLGTVNEIATAVHVMLAD